MTAPEHLTRAAELLLTAHREHRQIALPDDFAPRAGSAEYLRRLHGLDVESVLHRIRSEALRPRADRAVEAAAQR